MIEQTSDWGPRSGSGLSRLLRSAQQKHGTPRARSKAQPSPNSNSSIILKQAHMVHFLILYPPRRQNLESVQFCRPGVASKRYGVGGRACIVYLIPTRSTVYLAGLHGFGLKRFCLVYRALLTVEHQQRVDVTPTERETSVAKIVPLAQYPNVSEEEWR